MPLASKPESSSKLSPLSGQSYIERVIRPRGPARCEGANPVSIHLQTQEKPRLGLGRILYMSLPRQECSRFRMPKIRAKAKAPSTDPHSLLLRRQLCVRQGQKPQHLNHGFIFLKVSCSSRRCEVSRICPRRSLLMLLKPSP